MEYQEYNEIELLASVSLPRMTVKTPSSMLILITVLRDTSGEITDSLVLSCSNLLTSRCVDNGNGGWNIEVSNVIVVKSSSHFPLFLSESHLPWRHGLPSLPAAVRLARRLGGGCLRGGLSRSH